MKADECFSESPPGKVKMPPLKALASFEAN
jgi:hypothetical protein